jgi:hypothetical protein
MPIDSLVILPKQFAGENVNPFSSLFAALKSLEASFHTEFHDMQELTDMTSYSQGEGWLPNVLQGMKHVENISIRFHRINIGSDPYDLFMLFLQRSTRNDQGFICHDNDTGDSEYRLFNPYDLWFPDDDLYTLPSRKRDLSILLLSQPICLRTFRVNPWPKLARLDLAEMKSTKEDLAALLMTLAPSLQSLSSISIVLAKCPCSSLNRPGRFVQGFFWSKEDIPMGYEPWYKLIVMMNKILNLQECVLRFRQHGYYRACQDQFLRRKIEIACGAVPHRGINDRYPSCADGYVSKYILNAKDEGLASWALKNGYLDYLKV